MVLEVIRVLPLLDLFINFLELIAPEIGTPIFRDVIESQRRGSILLLLRKRFLFDDPFEARVALVDRARRFLGGCHLYVELTSGTTRN
jgi:hypothetical protein